MLYASYTFSEIQTWNQSLVATDVQNVAPRQTNISVWFTSTLMNILYTHKQPVTVCPAAVMTLAAVRKLHLWLTQLKQHTNSSEPRWSGSYFKRKPLATACVNLASQSTLPINNLSAYATLYAIFHSVCKPWKYAHSTRRKKHNSHKVHSLLTHQRNCSSSYGGRRSRRRTAASSIGCAPGEGTALLARALLKQPSLPASLSPASPAPPLCQCYQTHVSTWSGILQENPTRLPCQGSRAEQHVCSDVRRWRNMDSVQCCAASMGNDTGFVTYFFKVISSLRITNSSAVSSIHHKTW